MYRFQPTFNSSLPSDLGYSRPRYSRETYFNPLAELRAAEAAECEEGDLLRRLEEIQLEKQLARRRSQGLGYDAYSPSYLRSSEDQEFEHAAAVRRRQQELELEYLRRKRDQEAQLLALKMKEEEAKLQQLTRLREEEEARLRALRQHSQQVEAARQAKPVKAQKVYSLLSSHPLQKGSCYLQASCYPDDNIDLTTFLNQFFSNQAPVCITTIFNFLLVLISVLQRKVEHRTVPARRDVRTYDVNSEGQALDQLFSHLVQQVHQPNLKQKPAKEEPRKQTLTPTISTHRRSSENQGLDQLFSDFIQQLHQPEPKRAPVKEEAKKQAPAPVPAPKPIPTRESLPSPQSLEEVLRLIFNPQPNVSTPVREKDIATSSKAVDHDEVCEYNLVSPQAAMLIHSLQMELKAAETEKLQAAPAPEPRPTSALSLKEQLETRLNNDQSVEIRDTIQALLASLSDSPAQTSPASAPASSSKGKGKAPEAQTTSSSDDASKALESVKNIEATFITLQDDFEFPSDVDFSPAPSRSSSPAREGSGFASETDTPTVRKLAYTARNHPIRFYEQALTRLLAQLDEIESHGNADVRIKRKAVVALVEGALEELEKKVEARWNKWNKSQVRVDRDEDEAEVAEEKGNDNGAVGISEQPTADVADIPAIETVPQTTSDPIPETTSEAPIDIDTVSLVESSDVSPVEVPSYEEVVEHLMPEHTSESSIPVDELVSDSSPLSELIEETVEQEQAPQTIEDNGDSTDSSYPPVSSGASSIATIRASDPHPTSEYTSESEEEQGDSESDADLDTFLLPDIDSNNSFKQKEGNSEDVGSDWSEVEA